MIEMIPISGKTYIFVGTHSQGQHSFHIYFRLCSTSSLGQASLINLFLFSILPACFLFQLGDSGTLNYSRYIPSVGKEWKEFCVRNMSLGP